MVDPRVRACGQVVLHQLMEKVPTFHQQLGKNATVECVFHLIKAHHCHGRLVHLLFETLNGLHLISTELVVSVENANFQSNLDDIFDDLVSFLLALGIFTTGLVEFVQNLAAGIICEEICHGHDGHFAQDLLLGLKGQTLGVEALLPYTNKEESKVLRTALKSKNFPLSLSHISQFGCQQCSIFYRKFVCKWAAAF